MVEASFNSAETMKALHRDTGFPLPAASSREPRLLAVVKEIDIDYTTRNFHGDEFPAEQFRGEVFATAFTLTLPAFVRNLHGIQTVELFYVWEPGTFGNAWISVDKTNWVRTYESEVVLDPILGADYYDLPSREKAIWGTFTTRASELARKATAELVRFQEGLLAKHGLEYMSSKMRNKGWRETEPNFFFSHDGKFRASVRVLRSGKIELTVNLTANKKRTGERRASMILFDNTLGRAWELFDALLNDYCFDPVTTGLPYAQRKLVEEDEYRKRSAEVADKHDTLLEALKAPLLPPRSGEWRCLPGSPVEAKGDARAMRDYECVEFDVKARLTHEQYVTVVDAVVQALAGLEA